MITAHPSLARGLFALGLGVLLVGAECPFLPGFVGPEGGVVRSADDLARVTVPAGALDDPAVISIEPLDAGPLPAGPIPGTVYDFLPDGTQFAVPVTITIRYDETNLPVGLDETLLRLFVLVQGTWAEIAGSTVDPVTNEVTGDIDHFTPFAIVPILDNGGPPPAETPAIVYALNGDIWAIGPDGTGRVQLTSGPEEDRSPRWSHSGHMITFQRDDDIWTMNPDGTGQENRTNTPGIDESHPVWGPTNEIAYNRGPAGDVQIWVDGTRVTDASDPDFREHAIADWRTTMLITAEKRNPDNTFTQQVCTRTGGTPDCVTDGTTSSLACAWSPAGTRILFRTQNQQFQVDLFAMDPDGSNVERVTMTAGFDVPVCGGYAPLGDRVLYSALGLGGRSDLFVVDVATGAVTNISQSPGESEIAGHWRR